MSKRLVLTAISLLVAASAAASPAIAASDAELAAAVRAMYAEYRRGFVDVPEVSPDSLFVWMKSPSTVLVDVRSDDERDISIIPGAIAWRDYEAHSDSYDGLRIVLYCTIGYRSAEHAARLRAQGVNAHNLMAGILGWVHAGGTVEHDGESIHVVHVYGPRWSLLPSGYQPRW
jgi:sodium/bile acid cotransporter 7